MGLVIEKVSYRDFRNVHDLDLAPAPGLTILVGPNATGKTNCMEGIYLLTNGTTFRHLGSTSDLVREGAERGQVSCRLAGDKRVIDVSCEVTAGKKAFTINGKRRRGGECARLLPSVLFSPDDLMVVKGSASGRRDLLDGIGAQLNDGYGRILRDYTRALTQRNAMLRDEVFSGDLLDAWTSSLVAAGAMLYLYRRALVRRLAPYVRRAYGTLAPDEELTVTYEPSRDLAAGRDEEDRAAVGEAFARELAASAAEERRRHVTCVGPHKDDLGFAIDGREARLFGSQGQQRTVVLAVKMAHAALVRDMLGHYPVFLLDDVMSELDRDRRRALLSLIDTGMQTIVTTANLDYFTDEERDRAKVVSMFHGELREAGLGL